MLLLSIDAFHPGSNNWKIHIKGALTIVKKIGLSLSRGDSNGWIDMLGDEYSRNVKFLLKFNKLTYIFGITDFADSTDGGKPSTYIDIRDFDVIANMEEYDSDSLLYQTFGIRDSTLSALSNVVYLIQNRDKVLDYDREVKELDGQIIASRPSKLVGVSDFLNEEYTKLLIMYHQSVIFYVAVHIFFLREIKFKNLSEVQELVNEGIDHIEMLDELFKKSQSVLGLLWPYVIICSEANTLISQTRIRRWFEEMKSHNIASINTAIVIITAVWDRRRISENVRWADVKKEINPRLMLS